ncbi:acetoacetate--CoA ligase [Gordonia sp. SL306]|uniref:acetoacetate--CoA ligase n=1 Tax=Gordonia sp. SL306 TaxID=2995145 RepID=UPI00227149F1|nr:acetoacetate--CoA ligase [Gordonia sp. SL306]WAC54547.1 acetoacetate--CoA ligase [Gordonia sp. SL306]
MSATTASGEVTWTPPVDVRQGTEIGRFLGWLELRRGLTFEDYEDLWRWSIDDLAGFWSAIWEFFGVVSHAPYDTVLADDSMPGACWFPGATLNYAEHMLGTSEDTDTVAILGRSQTRDDVDLTFGQLREQVARARKVLQDLGVRRGDRVVGYLPNIPETLVAFLATASLGATWASCATEFGARSVIDRFGQVEPVVLLAAGGYRYGRKDIDLSERVRDIRAGLPTVRAVIDIEYGPWRVADALSWSALLDEAGHTGGPREAQFEPVPFDHPLVVLFSSGTTGKPKAIVHGHGGILLEHLKNNALSWDLQPSDRILWFSTTAWMMWNALVSALLTRAGIVLLDGDPTYPDLGWQWRIAEQTGVTLMGAAPGYLMACRGAGLDLHDADLKIRMVASAGSPLPPEGYAWIRAQLGPEVMLNVGSGGTDVCSGIVQNNPLLPVHAGQISGRALGVAAFAFDDDGREIIDTPGELVITRPMPSMPVGLWGDSDGTRMRDTYFDRWPGVWRHGDWITFGPDGSCVVSGRSDATLNRGGVRLGTAEFYRVVEELPTVSDSLVVHLEDPAGGNGRLILFVALADGADLDEDLRRRIASELRSALSPRHVPDDIIEVDLVPRNRTGKKLEIPVKRILQGAPPDQVASKDSLAEPTSLDAFAAFAGQAQR